MNYFAVGVGCLMILGALLDAFETIILPRTVKRAVRVSTVVIWLTQPVFAVIRRMKPSGRRQAILVAHPSLLLLGLFALWAFMLICGFALVNWGSGVALTVARSIDAELYYSGVTFFTLGFGDITPTGNLGRSLAVLEAGVGFGFLALIISYVPVMYGAFSRREVTMLLLDSKAGSDPTAAELLRRHAELGCFEPLMSLLKDWERFSAELLESYLSYPLLAFYRSQHDNQSWLRSLTAILDGCAVIEAGFASNTTFENSLKFQARATFAMARHVVVDLAYVLGKSPIEVPEPRLTSDMLIAIRVEMASLGFPLDESPAAQARLEGAIKMYEPYVASLAHHMIIELPQWLPEPHALDNWQTSAWEGVKHF